MKRSKTVTVKLGAGKDYNWTYLAEIISKKIINGGNNNDDK